MAGGSRLSNQGRPWLGEISEVASASIRESEESWGSWWFASESSTTPRKRSQLQGNNGLESRRQTRIAEQVRKQREKEGKESECEDGSQEAVS
jgi:hypothetical protein